MRHRASDIQPATANVELVNSEPTAQRTGARRGTIVAGVTVGLVAAAFGWQAVTNDATTDPDPSNSNETLEWKITEPTVDLGDLAGVHASSRLQYDECQQDYAGIASEPSSGTHPLYFC